MKRVICFILECQSGGRTRDLRHCRLAALTTAPGPSPLRQALGLCKIGIVVQAVRGFSVHFWKKLPFFAQMISNMYSLDPDIAQSILTRLTPN